MRNDALPLFRDLPRPAAEARRLVQLGLSVFPLRPKSKEPAVAGGFRAAACSRTMVREHAKEHPNDNYGLRVGGDDGIFVIDVDGPEGEREWIEVVKRYGALPRTVTTITARGAHYLYRSGKHRVPCSSSKLAPGIDVKGDGGYVVAAGSVHPSGHRYVYAEGCAPNEVEIAPAPAWLLDLITQPHHRVEEMPVTAQPALHLHDTARTTAYVEAALKDEVEKLNRAPKGQRNISLNTAAFKLGRLTGRGLDARAVSDRLTEAGRAIGLGESEIAKTVASGLQAGLAQPRALVQLQERAGGIPTHAPERLMGDPHAAELALLGETDADNADRFARRHRNTVAYVPGRGILVYKEGIWRPGGDTIALRLAEDTARGIVGEAAHLGDPGLQKRRQDWSKHSLSKPALERMVGLAKGRLEVTDDAFDAQPWLLCVANGTLDLRSGKLRPHDPADRLTRMAPVAFDPDARCPEFRRFLDDSLGGDRETIAYLQKAIGMTLAGDVSAQVLHYLKGCGNSGKTTLVNLMRELLSGYACHTGVETFTVKRFEPIPADLARLAGMRLVTAGEINHTQQFDEARVKGMTGGDPITARHLYGHPFEYRPQFKLWLYANDFPKVRATDDAFWRRMRVIPFNIAVAPGRIDPELPAKLRAEGPGILNWALKGCLAWQREGLTPPKGVLEATAEWRHGADHVRRYLRERTKAVPDARTPAAVLYADLKAWCEEVGEKVPSMAGLKQRLLELGQRAKPTKKGSFWVGLQLRG